MAGSPLRRLRLWTWETYFRFQGMRVTNPYVYRLVQGASLSMLFFGILFGVWLVLHQGIDAEESVQKRLDLYNKQNLQ